MPDRVIVFIDYQNAYMRAREAFFTHQHPHPRGQFHPLRLGERLASLTQGNAELGQVRVYCGMPSNAKDPKGYAARRRQIAHWRTETKVHVVSRPLRYPRDFPASKAEEKGIDVQLAVDLIAMALRDEYDVAIVVSEDTDLRPAIEAVLDLPQKRRVEVATWDTALRSRRGLRVPGRQLLCHFLTSKDYRGMEDKTDYAMNRRSRGR